MKEGLYEFMAKMIIYLPYQIKQFLAKMLYRKISRLFHWLISYQFHYKQRITQQLLLSKWILICFSHCNDLFKSGKRAKYILELEGLVYIGEHLST